MSKQNFLLAGIVSVVFAAGLTIGMRFSPTSAEVQPKNGEPRVLFYRNPMNPIITSPTPAKDEMGMDYIPVYEGDAQGSGDPSVVSIAPEIVNNLGVRTEAAVHSELSRHIETVGYVGYDEHMLSHVHLRAEGWLEDLQVHAAGDRVKKGQLLFRYYSPELVNAQEEFLQALAAKDTRLVELSRQRLTALGLPPAVAEQLKRHGSVQQRLPVYANQDGVLAELNVREGMYVGREMDVMTLADLSSVWVIVEVFEQQSAWVHEGQGAEVRLASLPDKVWQGQVAYIYPNLDPKTRTLRVRLRFTNPGIELKPNMYATATIFTDAHTALNVARDAVIRTEHGARVIKALDSGHFTPVDVTPGIESGDRVEILDGLQEGDKVVVSAQFLIDSEANLRAALRRLSSPEESAPKSAAAKTIQAIGMIKSIDTAAHKIHIAHEPIKALGWPSMAMDFPVATEVALDAWQPGTRIDFDLVQRDPVTYEITALRAASGGGQ